jgi:hypothetical protein
MKVTALSFPPFPNLKLTNIRQVFFTNVMTCCVALLGAKPDRVRALFTTQCVQRQCRSAGKSLDGRDRQQRHITDASRNESKTRRHFSRNGLLTLEPLATEMAARAE